MVTPQLRIKCNNGHTSIVGKETTHCPECNEKAAMGWKVAFEPGKIAQQTKDRTMRVLINKYNYMQWYPGIAEQGYDDKPMIADNWNDYPKRFVDWLESYFDCEVDWFDEWMSCCDCGKAIRQSPDSYGWEPSYVWVSDCEIVCHDCIESDPSDMIEEHKNKTTHAIPSWAYPLIEQAGFVCYSPDEYCQRFETGFHPGQDDSPEEVAKDIEENLPGYDYIFKLDSCGQFDVHWSVYIRKQQEG